MQVLLDDVERPAVRATPEPRLLEGEAVVLRVRLGPDEELAEAQLWLSDDPATSEPAFAKAPVFATDKGSELTAIQWVSADWGGPRSLEQISAELPAAVNVGVRVSVGRGASQWYAPPGPTAAAFSGTDIAFSFPEAVADRVLLEFVTLVEGTPSTSFTTVNLESDPSLVFGRQARDFEVGLADRRAFFRRSGTAGGEAAVPELLATLQRELEREPLGDIEIALAISAGVAGYVGLRWAFVRNRIVRTFTTGGPRRELELPFAGEARLGLFALPNDDPNADRAQPQSLSLTSEVVPVREYLALDAPAEQLGERLGMLVAPLRDAAQGLTVTLDDPLVGVSLWARPLSALLHGTLELVTDLAGSPRGEVVASAALSREDPEFATRGPRWLDIDFPEPVQASGRLWVVLRIDTGEVSWLLGRPRDPATSGAPHDRPNNTAGPRGGAWLSRERRDPQAWALTRLRAREPGDVPAPRFELLLTEAPATPSSPSPAPQVIPLQADANGRISWTPEDPTAVPTCVAIELRVRSSAAARVTLDNLHLSLRDVPIDLGDTIPDDSLPGDFTVSEG